MNDHAELSLAVARIMWPELPWRTHVGSQVIATEFTGMDWDKILMVFDYRTDASGFKMAVWLANSEEPDSWEIGWFRGALEQDNPHRALAEAIKEIGNG